MFQAMLSLQLEMFLLIALGFGVTRAGIIDGAGERALSSLLIYVILPCNILHGFINSGRPTPEFLLNCAIAFGLSMAIQMVATFGSRLVFRRMAESRAPVASYGMIVSNSSFVGLPVAEALYSGVGVTYTSVFQIPIRFTMWSAGLALFCDTDRRETVRRVVTHPCIVACGVGLAMMCLGVGLPGVAGTTLDAISSCTTPVSMIAIGSILSTAEWGDVLSRDTVAFCLLRLVAFPLFVWVALGPLGLDPTVRGIAVLMSAMPAGSTTAILPERYGGDARYGAGLVMASTTLSMVTLPLLALLPM